MKKLLELKQELDSLPMDGKIEINGASVQNIYIAEPDRKFKLTGISKTQYGEVFDQLERSCIYADKNIAAKFLYYAQTGVTFKTK